LLASVEATADLADVLVATVEAMVAAGRVRTENVGGELKVRVDDLIQAILEALGPPAPAPLTRRLEDRRRRRAAAGELPLFDDGDEAEGTDAR
jgi:nucleoside-diphosphate-sugar epimerase